MEAFYPVYVFVSIGWLILTLIVTNVDKELVQRYWAGVPVLIIMLTWGMFWPAFVAVAIAITVKER